MENGKISLQRAAQILGLSETAVSGYTRGSAPLLNCDATAERVYLEAREVHLLRHALLADLENYLLVHPKALYRLLESRPFVEAYHECVRTARQDSIDAE